MRYLCLMIVMAMLMSDGLAADTPANKLPAPVFEHTGNYHRPISTKVPLAQKYFDQGMFLFYGFEWGEAARSFRAAAQLDPNCAMCYWGIALALTYKSNEPVTGTESEEAKEAIQKAVALSPHATLQERAYINAMAIPYQAFPNKKMIVLGCGMSGHNQMRPDLQKYLQALSNIIKQYPKDNDAKNIYAAALFWNMHDLNQRSEVTAARISQLLKGVLANDPNNIGAIHYYIHAIEASPNPSVALKSAKTLDAMTLDSEHLVHMPSHIYFLTGRYHEASNSNLRAIDTYKKYQTLTKQQGFEPLFTYLYFHDIDFLRSAAVMEGRKGLALSATKQINDNLPADWLTQNPDLQWFIPIAYFVKARFGMWEALLQTPKPDAAYQYALGMWYYATGLAYANTGNIKAAEASAQALQTIIDKKSVTGTKEQTLLNIANNILNATLENLQGNEKTTLAYLKKADRLQSDMRYHEPPDWYFPVKEAIGDVYLKYKQPKAAIAMYQAILKKYPANGWALFGLMQAYEQLGDKKKAAQIQTQFKTAWQYADIPTPVKLFR